MPLTRGCPGIGLFSWSFTALSGEGIISSLFGVVPPGVLAPVDKTQGQISLQVLRPKQ